MNGLTVPEPIGRQIAGKPYRRDDMGMSGAQILLFEDCVLKIVKYRRKNAETVRVMRWLEGKLPVPRVLGYAEDGARQYLLMSRVPGRMACDAYWLERPGELLSLLAEGLDLLWSVDVTGCPRNRDLDAELREAGYRVENRLADQKNAEPGTYGPGGFRDPESLLKWLEDNRPSPEPVLSHGDFCLPNVFLRDGRISGFIDLGDTGIGDRWRDIALCCRSLRHNFDGTYGGKVYPGFDPELLFRILGMEPDREKLRYYTLLDELF